MSKWVVKQGYEAFAGSEASAMETESSIVCAGRRSIVAFPFVK